MLDIQSVQPGELVSCGKCGKTIQVPVDSTSPGAILGDYIIEKELGHGVLGRVFLAHQISLDRDVALRLYPEELSSDASFAALCKKEAGAAARVTHQNVVQTYTGGPLEGFFFLSQEFIAGDTMKSLLSTGVVPPEMMPDLAEAIVSGLQVAWEEQKLLHRNLRPENIILTADGTPKLLDLGVTRSPVVIQPNGAMKFYSSYPYIAPELLEGQPPNVLSDIFSLGATFHHLLSGKVPRAEGDVEAPFRPICEENPNVSPALGAVIDKMVNLKPDQRPQSYKELIAAIRDARSGISPSSTTGKRKLATGKLSVSGTGSAIPLQRKSQNAPQDIPKKKSPLAMILGIVAVLVVLGGGAAAFFLKGNQEDKPAATEATPGTNAPATISVEQRKFNELKALAASNDRAKALTAIVDAAPVFAPPSKLAAQYCALAAPFIEEALAEARKPALDKFEEEWNKRVERTRQEDIAKKEEAERKAKQAELARQAAALKAAEERRVKQRHEDFLASQSTLRTEILKLTNQFDFDGAISALADLDNSTVPEERKWAKGWISLLNKANSLYKLHRNSGDKFKGTNITVLADKLKWQIADISFDEISIINTRIVYKDHKETEETQNAKLDLKNLLPPQFTAITEAAVKAGEVTEADSQLMQYVFLGVQGANPNSSKSTATSIRRIRISRSCSRNSPTSTARSTSPECRNTSRPCASVRATSSAPISKAIMKRMTSTPSKTTSIPSSRNSRDSFHASRFQAHLP
ncbi:MAG: protein kinase [Victivallales bacterium]|nr:protein kinase [Victivallales bacterium]